VSGREASGGRFCPNCGSEAADAKFCPQCGTDLAAVREALWQSAQGGLRTAADSSAPRATGGSSGRTAPQAGIPRWVLIGGGTVAALVIAAIVLYAVFGSQDGGSVGAGASSGATTTASPVAADTGGSYAQLVDRGNGLYDQGSSLFTAGKVTEAATYFAAAAKVYAAAWQKQPGDANLGTDWASSLFYSGDISAALEQVDVVLAKNPGFQPALYNKGNFLQHAARLAEDAGDSSAVATLKAQAKAAYKKAVAVDPTSTVGKQAAQAAKRL